jgi:hypothetical protein
MAKTLAKLQARARKRRARTRLLHARSRRHGRSKRSMLVTSERKTFGRMACGTTRNTAISG